MNIKKPKLKIGIINFYLFKEALSNFGICLLIFTFTILMSQVFKLTELVINKGFGLLETLKFIGHEPFIRHSYHSGKNVRRR